MPLVCLLLLISICIICYYFFLKLNMNVIMSIQQLLLKKCVTIYPICNNNLWHNVLYASTDKAIS